MQQQEFKPKTITYDTDVKITLNVDRVTAIANNGSSTIESKNLDNIHYIEISERRLTPVGLIARTFGIGFILLLLCGNEWKAMVFQGNPFSILCFWAGILLMLISVISFFAAVIDAFTELGLFDRIIGKYFSNHGYKVTIGNKSGNNIVFAANQDELSQVKLLEKYIDELKKIVPTEQAPAANKPEVIETPKADMLDSLKKLGDLYQNGVLTKDEFDKKKAELLSK